MEIMNQTQTLVVSGAPLGKGSLNFMDGLAIKINTIEYISHRSW